MRLLVIAIICLFFAGGLHAQDGKVYGTLIDKETKEPLIGVNVVAHEGGTVGSAIYDGAVSDLDGNYELILPPGNYLLVYKYLGYETLRKRVKIGKGAEIEVNFEMETEAKNLEIVTVSASKYEKKYGEESVTVGVLTPEFIENTNTTSLNEALDKMPGVNMVGETVNIRGGAGFNSSAGSRVLLLLDGVPLLTPQSSSIEFGTLPLENIKQVEVLKGASSTLYGSSALNGTINVITENPRNDPFTKIGMFYGFYERPFKGKKKDYYWADRLPMSYGLSFVHRRKIKRFDLAFDGAYTKDETHLYKNKQNQARFNLKTRFRPKRNDRLTIGFNANLAYKFGDFFFLWEDWDTTNVGDSLGYIPNEIADLQELPVNLDPYVTYFDKKGNKHSIKTRWYYARTRSSNGENTNCHLTYGEYTFHHSMKKLGIDVVAGMMAQYNNIDSEVFQKRTSKNGAVFLQVDKKFFDRLTLTAGFRTELFKLDKADVEIQPIARGGVNLQVAEASYFRLGGGMGFRYPSIAEKFAKLQRSGQYVVPNINLMPEKSWSAELGFKQGFKISKWVGYLDLSGFITQYQNMIEFTVAPDSVKDQYYPDIFFAFWSDNITDSRISGLEFSAIGQGYIFGVKTNFLIGYTYLVPVDLNYDPELPKYAGRKNILNYRFQHSAKGDIDFEYRNFNVGFTAFINSFMENVDPLVVLAPGIKEWREQHHGPTYSVDARIAYNFFETAKVSFIVKNITNNQYSIRPGFMDAPRNYTVQLAYEF